uniref:Uncharacterized protein n=1 Tax=Glossina morsitans morsitans TaxID=37546 RepID=A0A1B0GD48_GLOMM
MMYMMSASKENFNLTSKDINRLYIPLCGQFLEMELRCFVLNSCNNNLERVQTCCPALED